LFSQKSHPITRMAESEQLAVAARVRAQRAYKKVKKKRAKVNLAEKKRGKEQGLGLENKQAEKAAPTKWHRAVRGDGCPKATDRPVDDANINELLEKRSEAKAEKNYTLSDEITDTLIDMEIVYNDEKKQWHTRLLSTVGQKAKKEQAKKRAIGNKAEPGEPAAKKTKR
jgi:cysteinyl-tRNA synthetase